MIKKENFCKILMSLIGIDHQLHKLEKSLDPFCHGSLCFSELMSHQWHDIKTALENEMNDTGIKLTHYNSYIDYWIEMYHMTDGDTNHIEDDNGKPIYITTPKQLYDFLIQENNEKRKFLQNNKCFNCFER